VKFRDHAFEGRIVDEGALRKRNQRKKWNAVNNSRSILQQQHLESLGGREEKGADRGRGMECRAGEEIGKECIQ
jgi:hypothetical protein